MSVFLWTLSFPFLFFSIFLEIFMTKNFREDLDNCLAKINNSEKIPNTLIKALVIAEDHRSNFHPGIDPVAIGRTLLFRIKNKNRGGGASTIEQQFSRVITGRYERTFIRKFREQMLAIMISRRMSKSSIASAYLTVAYYGTGFVGISGLREHFDGDLENISFQQALHVVVFLKYPRPRNPNKAWNRKVARRTDIILRRLESDCYYSTRTKLAD